MNTGLLNYLKQEKWKRHSKSCGFQELLIAYCSVVTVHHREACPKGQPVGIAMSLHSQMFKSSIQRLADNRHSIRLDHHTMLILVIFILLPVLQHSSAQNHVSPRQRFNYTSSVEFIAFLAYSAQVATDICKRGDEGGDQHYLSRGFYLCRILH